MLDERFVEPRKPTVVAPIADDAGGEDHGRLSAVPLIAKALRDHVFFAGERSIRFSAIKASWQELSSEMHVALDSSLLSASLLTRSGACRVLTALTLVIFFGYLRGAGKVPRDHLPMADDGQRMARAHLDTTQLVAVYAYGLIVALGNLIQP